MISKVAILCAVFAAAHATALYGAPLLSTGVSSSARTQDAIGNYAFNYGIADGIGATNSRAESGDAHGNKIGSYTLTDIDGRARRVDYVADAAGFRASVKTNEPGTAMSAPAAAAVVSPYAMRAAPVAAAPVVAAAAPVAAYSTAIGHGAAIGAPLGLYGAGIYGAGLYGGGLYGGGLYGAGLHGAGLYGAGLYGAGLYGKGYY